MSQRRNEVGREKPHLTMIDGAWFVRSGSFCGFYPTFARACRGARTSYVRAAAR